MRVFSVWMDSSDFWLAGGGFVLRYLGDTSGASACMAFCYLILEKRLCLLSIFFSHVFFLDDFLSSSMRLEIIGTTYVF